LVDDHLLPAVNLPLINGYGMAYDLKWILPHARWRKHQLTQAKRLFKKP